MNNYLNLKIEKNKLLVNFSSDLMRKSEYAFYLYKNNVKEAVKWYSSSSSAVFDLASGGSYKVKVFLRSDAGDFLSSFISEDIAYNIPAHDLSRWGRCVKVDMDEFISSKSLSDGCIRINIDDEYVELLVDGIDRLDVKRGVLVCFTGAVPKRINKSAPFFSGLNVAKNLNVPLISISDPSLAKSNKLALAWYAGNEEIKDLPLHIANILDHISDVLCAKLVLFGGSGGGFAVLSVIDKMTREAYGAVWNPQTSITNFNEKAVLNYVDICFPGFNHNFDIYTYLESFNICHDLTVSYKSGDLTTIKKNVLYLQNEGDTSHVERHALPFMNALLAKKECNNIFSTSAGICFWFKYWGDGHLVPSQKIIAYVLDNLLYGHCPLDIAYLLNGEVD